MIRIVKGGRGKTQLEDARVGQMLEHAHSNDARQPEFGDQRRVRNEKHQGQAVSRPFMLHSCQHQFDLESHDRESLLMISSRLYESTCQASQDCVMVQLRIFFMPMHALVMCIAAIQS